MSADALTSLSGLYASRVERAEHDLGAGVRAHGDATAARHRHAHRLAEAERSCRNAALVACAASELAAHAARGTRLSHARAEAASALAAAEARLADSALQVHRARAAYVAAARALRVLETHLRARARAVARVRDAAAEREAEEIAVVRWRATRRWR